MIQKIIERLPRSNAPILEPYYEYNGVKVIAIGLKKGIVLQKHTAPCKAQILVIKGEITFKTQTSSVSLKTYESFHIPLRVEHEVKGDTDAVFLLILSR